MLKPDSRVDATIRPRRLRLARLLFGVLLLAGVSPPAGGAEPVVIDDVEVESATPSATLEPPAIDFGTVARGTDAVRREVRIANDGNTTVQVESVLLDGSADFVAGEGCDGAVLAPGARCTIAIDLRPREVGLQQARLEITGSFGRPLAAVVSGTVVDASPSPSPSPSLSPSASGTFESGDVDHPAPPPVGAPWEEAGFSVVLLGVLLLAGVLVLLPRLRSQGRVRGRPPGRVSLVPGARYQEIASPASVVVVSLGLDPVTGTSQWTQRSEP